MTLVQNIASNFSYGRLAMTGNLSLCGRYSLAAPYSDSQRLSAIYDL